MNTKHLELENCLQMSSPVILFSFFCAMIYQTVL